MNTVTVAETKPQTKQLSLFRIGTFIKLENGHIVLRTTDGYFDLCSGSEHGDVWAYGEELPKGSTLNITIGTTFDLAFYQVDRVKEFLRANKKIDAIKYVREITSSGLKEAKDYVGSLNTPELSMEAVLGKNESRQDESSW